MHKPDDLLFEIEDRTADITVTRHYDRVTGEPRIRVELMPRGSDTTFVYSMVDAIHLAYTILRAVRRANIPATEVIENGTTP